MLVTLSLHKNCEFCQKFGDLLTFLDKRQFEGGHELFPIALQAYEYHRKEEHPTISKTSYKKGPNPQEIKEMKKAEKAKLLEVMFKKN